MNVLRNRHFAEGPLPVLIWVFALLTSAWMLRTRANTVEYIGIARTLRHDIVAGETGMVRTVAVDLLDHVDKNDVIVVLDDHAILASLNTAEAELQALTAEVKVAGAGTGRSAVGSTADLAAELRRFQVDAEERRIKLLELKVEIETAEIERQRLDLRYHHIRELFDKEFASQAELDDARLQRDAVAARVARSNALFARLNKEYAAAAERSETFEQRLPTDEQRDEALQILRASVQAQAARIQELELRRERLILKAPADGQVVRVWKHDGATVLPGEQIVSIVQAESREIVVYVPERDARIVDQVDKARITRSTLEPQIIDARVVSRGSAVEMFPERIWSRRGVPEFGRSAIVSVGTATRLLPGEVVAVQLSNES